MQRKIVSALRKARTQRQLRAVNVERLEQATEPRNARERRRRARISRGFIKRAGAQYRPGAVIQRLDNAAKGGREAAAIVAACDPENFAQLNAPKSVQFSAVKLAFNARRRIWRSTTCAGRRPPAEAAVIRDDLRGAARIAQRRG
jgi:hypothetical protein